MNKIENILWQAKLQKNKNWLKVRKLLKEGLEEFPEEKELMLALADLYLSKKIYRKAIEQYQKALELDRNNEFTIFRIGNCFLSLNEYRIAIDYYEKLEKQFPELLYNLAFAYSKIGRVDKSLEILTNLLNFKVNSELPYLFLAELYFSKNKFKKAIEYIDKAEKSFGKRGTICYLRGLAYFQLRNWLKAYVEFQHAEKLKVGSFHFYRNFGLTCEKIGKTSEAINLILKSVKLSPLDPVGYIELIKIYLVHNRYMEAYSMVQLAKRNVPFSITLSMLYNQILKKINKHNLLKI